MRILVVCDSGEHRSVAMTYVLHEMGHQAVPISYYLLENCPTFYVWADFVFRMDEAHDKIPSESHELDAWIGRDVWSHPRHPELIELCKKKAQELLSK